MSSTSSVTGSERSHDAARRDVTSLSGSRGKGSSASGSGSGTPSTPRKSLAKLPAPEVVWKFYDSLPYMVIITWCHDISLYGCNVTSCLMCFTWTRNNTGMIMGVSWIFVLIVESVIYLELFQASGMRFSHVCFLGTRAVKGHFMFYQVIFESIIGYHTAALKYKFWWTTRNKSSFCFNWVLKEAWPWLFKLGIRWVAVVENFVFSKYVFVRVTM